MCERMLPPLWGTCFLLVMVLSPVLGVLHKGLPLSDVITETVPSDYSHTSESSSFTTGRVIIDAVTQEISNDAATQHVSDVAVTQDVSDVSVTHGISFIQVIQEVSNGAMTQDVGSDIAGTQEISSVAVAKEISSVAVAKEISTVTVTPEISIGAVTQDVSDIAMAQELSSVAVIQEISSVAVPRDVSSVAVTRGVSYVAGTQEISNFAVTQDISNFAVTQDISNFALTQDISNFAVTQDISNFAVTQDISDVSGSQEINSIAVTQGSSVASGGINVAHRGPIFMEGIPGIFGPTGSPSAGVQPNKSVTVGLEQNNSSSPHENVTTVSPIQCNNTATVTMETMEDLCEGTVSEWSCNGSCGHRRELPCSCDVTCLLHQTCCDDFMELCPALASLAKEIQDQFPGISTVCESSFGALVVADCPNNATTDEKRLCRAENPASLRDEVPVTDTLFYWHFKNVHCWKCWKTQGQAMLWTANISMSDRKQAEDDYSFHTIRQFMTENPQLVEWLPPDFMVKAHCSDTVISKCPSCVSDQNIVNQCEEGSHSYLLGPINGNRRFIYKNHYCYLCNLNNMTTEKQICTLPQSFQLGSHRHEMFFSIMMIFTPEDEGKIKMILEEKTEGPYLWNSLICSETDGICQADECSEDSINVDGRCDSSMASVQYTIQLCSVDVSANTCKTGLTFREMFNTDLKAVKEWMRETVTEAMVQSDRTFNQTVIDVLVYDTEDKGLVVTAISIVKKEFSDEAQMLSPHVEMLFHNNLEVSGAVGPIIACMKVGPSQKVEILPYTGATCHQTAVCDSAPP